MNHGNISKTIKTISCSSLTPIQARGKTISNQFSNSIYLLDDGRAGHRHQCQALITTLLPGAAYYTIDLAQAKTLSRPEHSSLIIGCGRRAARVSAELKQRLGPIISNIQILNPVTSPENQLHMWDWLLIPNHDEIRGPNILNFHGALVCQPPRAKTATHLVILIGAASKNLSWDQANLDIWLQQAQAQSLPVILCPSQRTTATSHQQLQQATVNNINWQLVAANNYSAYQQALAQAAEYWVSGDSINMVAEACASPLAVKILGKEQASGKLVNYFTHLDQLGRLSSAAPLIEVTGMAEQLIRRGALLA